MEALANLKVFSGSSNLELAKDICHFIGIPLGDARVTCFPDGETFVQINENIRGADVFLIQSTSAPANHNIMELLIMVDAARRASAGRITVVMPFYGYARQDRKDRPRVPITAKLVANLIEAAGANRVLGMDFHAQQITGFFEIQVDHLFAAPVFFRYLQRYLDQRLAVCSPDLGGLKMAAAYADALGCPLAMVAKRRMDADRVEALHVIGDVEGYDVLIVDDMTETGGTLFEAAKRLKEAGARSVRAAVSHGVLNEQGFTRLKNSAIDELITTNSTRIRSNDLPMTILNVAELFGEAIMRIHQNASVTSLFNLKGY